jgi:hypothetical protein
MNPRRRRNLIVPDEFNFEEAREMFLNPEVIRDKKELDKLVKFEKCNEKDLKSFLCYSKGFGEIKVDAGIKKLIKF